MSVPVTLPPTLSGALRSSKRALIGMWVCSGSPVAAEICAGSGLDWLLIDMEHTANGLESILTQLQVVAAYPVVPLVRVPTGDAVIIKQVLDLGAQNLLVPMVEDAAQAAAIVAATRYPPEGVRGVGSALGRGARWNRVPSYLAEAASTISVTVQIESTAALRNVESIVATPGVDAIFVGPSDLAASMGLLGQQDHAEVAAAVERCIEVGRHAGVPVGVNAFVAETADRYLAAGAAFVSVGADVAVLARASEALRTRFIESSSDTVRASY